MVNMDAETHEAKRLSPSMKNTLLLINCLVLSIGHCGGPLVTRLYFIHGGKRVWLSSCLLTAGWPFILIIFISTFCFRRATISNYTAKLFNIRPRLFLASAFIGILTGVDDYIYAYGVARLPVSTVALIIASQLAFTAGFAYLLVKQKFSSFSVNAVVLLTIGSGVLALHTSSDRPDGESKREYVLGFVMTLGAAALYGFILPLIELTYQKAKQIIDYQLVMEIQMVMCLFATLFCIVGMLINNDFKKLTRKKMAAGSLVSSTLASTNVTLVPRSRTVYKKSACHRPIGLHGSVVSGNRCSLYRRDIDQLQKNIAKSRRNVVVYSSIVPPEVDIPSLPTSIGIPDQWQAWLMGAVVTIGLPFLTNKWGPLLGWIEKFKGTLQTAENITEAVEDMAGKVDKMVEEMEASLPEGKLKNALHTVELAAEEIARDADRLDQLIDKVQEMEEKFEDLIEEGNEVAKEIKTPKQI